MKPTAVVVVVVGLSLAACGPPPRAPSKDGPDALKAATEGEFTIPGFDARPYILRLPPGYEAGTPIPVVLLLHGGGGNARNGMRMTCASGTDIDDTCLAALADAEGFALVAPNGTSNILLEDLRTWNAGGGLDGWQCVSGDACKNSVDDLAYFDELHRELLRAFDVDEQRVYATGHSNGGAMSHRLACERSMRFAAVASVAGGNQVAVVQGCTPARAVSVLEIHGDADPCWTFETSTAACAQNDDLKKIGTQETIDGWVERNGCAPAPEKDSFEDREDDGTRAVAHTFGTCENDAEVELVVVEDGGHTWPQGFAYSSQDRVGRVSRDFSANEHIWTFFVDHPLR